MFLNLKRVTMKLLIVIPLLGLFATSCSTQSGGRAPSASALKQSVVAKGTLASAPVAGEAASTVRALAGGGAKISQYVIKNPSGRVGSKSWQELWTYNPGSQEKNFRIIFNEDGKGSANFEIEEIEEV
jgi:hypothetical protein